MKLPGGADAIVEISKLLDYCLDPHHPRGRHKARVFFSTLGLTRSDADFLSAALLRAARDGDAIASLADEYGDRYTIDFKLSRAGREARIRSAWIVRRGESAPGCFVILD